MKIILVELFSLFIDNFVDSFLLLFYRFFHFRIIDNEKKTRNERKFFFIDTIVSRQLFVCLFEQVL